MSDRVLSQADIDAMLNSAPPPAPPSAAASADQPPAPAAEPGQSPHAAADQASTTRDTAASAPAAEPTGPPAARGRATSAAFGPVPTRTNVSEAGAAPTALSQLAARIARLEEELARERHAADETRWLRAQLAGATGQLQALNERLTSIEQAARPRSQRSAVCRRSLFDAGVYLWGIEGGVWDR